jgi:hypothetical protein
MFWNHPTVSEAKERPERDLRDLAATLTSDATFLETGPQGPGLYAQAKVLTPYAPLVEELAPHIGVSIRGTGKAKAGEAEGRKGPIIEKLVAAHSVDFVTEPGAGGSVVQLFESARPRANPQEDPKMELTEARIQELFAEALKPVQESLAAATTENARLREGMVIRDAHAYVTGLLGPTRLMDSTKARLLERLTANPPTKDGALDQETFKPLIEAAVKEEVEYLAGVSGSPVRHMSTQESGEVNVDEANKKLESAFASIGLSESTAKLAAAGR